MKKVPTTAGVLKETVWMGTLGTINLHVEGMQREQRSQTIEELRTLVWAFPAWLQRLWVVYTPELDSEKGWLLETSVDYAYRQTTIRVAGAFFHADTDCERRMECWLHEIVHIHTNGFADWARMELKRLCGEDAPKYAGSLSEELSRKVEAMVVDLTAAIRRKP